jgi:acetyltransferase-like isoleucine patch superfamily enzyme
VKVLLRKLLNAPPALYGLLNDRVLVPGWVRMIGVGTGQGCRFHGRPTIRLAPGARIALGDEVALYSRFDSNVLGLPHPTILASVAPGSAIEIGDGSGISGASIVARCAITIGKRVFIGAGACIWDSDFHPLDADLRREHPTRDARSAPVRIEDEVFIGARALILKGVTVGRRAVVGAAAVVTKDVNPGDIVAGNPARVVGRVPSRPGGKALV